MGKRVGLRSGHPDTACALVCVQVDAGAGQPDLDESSGNTCSIRRVQVRLAALGCLLHTEHINRVEFGSYTAQTVSQVSRFQHIIGLPRTGVYDQTTHLAMMWVLRQLAHHQQGPLDDGQLPTEACDVTGEGAPPPRALAACYDAINCSRWLVMEFQMKHHHLPDGIWRRDTQMQLEASALQQARDEIVRLRMSAWQAPLQRCIGWALRRQ